MLKKEYVLLGILVVCALVCASSLTRASIDNNQLAFIFETVDTSVDEPGTSISLDSNDHPHILYRKIISGLGELRYAHHNGSTWIIETIDSIKNVSFYMEKPQTRSLCLDSNGYPHISYTIHSFVSPYDAGNILKYAHFNGTSWTTEIVIEESSLKSSIAVDSQKNPHISYFEPISDTLKYAHFNGSSWLIDTIGSYGSGAGFQSIAVDSYDRPHIAYSNGYDLGNLNLTHAYLDGTSWVIETIDRCSGHGSMAIDSLDNIHIGLSGVGLKYAYYDGTSWSTQIIAETIGETVNDISIALSSHDNPYIAYNELKGFDLKLAYYNSTSWNVETVRSAGDCGLSNSIALDSRDYPHISFGTANIQYARGGVSPIASFTYLPSKPIGGEIVNFDASTSYDPDGNLASYTWDFGDGTTVTETDPTTTHAYMDAGNFTAILKVTDSEGFSATATQLITTAKLDSTICISLSSSTSYVGFKVEVNGNLTCNDIGLSGAPILLSYSVTSGESWNDITLVNTASDGSYSAVWMPSATGNYLVRTTWSGNSTYPRTTTIINLAVILFEEQNVFSVTSNSTVSELVFKSENRELSFQVSGLSGTTGYVDVYVAKTLIGNIANVEVKLNGEQINYTATSTDDSWFIHFTYMHSIHEVTINLGDISHPLIEISLVQVLLLGILVSATIALVIYYVSKRKKSTLTVPADKSTSPPLVSNI